MNITCDKCGKRYAITDDKLVGKPAVKIRCKQCQNLISVSVPAELANASAPAVASASAASVRLSSAPPARMDSGGAAAAAGWDDQPTRALPPMDLSAIWFAMIGGQQQGPFSLPTLEQKVKSSELSLRTYLWKQGMEGWKRAADVPEVQPVFAGVKTGPPAQSAPPPATPAAKPVSQARPAVQRDVALSNEVPSPEIAGGRQFSSPNPLLDAPGPAVLERKQARAPQPEAAAPAPAPAPAPEAGAAAQRPAQGPSLSGIFDDVSAPHEVGALGNGAGAAAPSAENAAPAKGASDDPFAAFGPADPAQAPAPGEATKFFIAQAGVNKRNPPWKIALFAMVALGFPAAVLYLLSSLHVVNLEVTRTTETGEVVTESFFSTAGVSGFKDLLTGEEAKRREKAEATKRQRLLAAAQKAQATKPGVGPQVVEQADRAIVAKKPESGVDSALAASLLGGDEGPAGSVQVVKDRNKVGAAAVDSSAGLSEKAVSETITTKGQKAFEACIQQALTRNPNLKVGKILLKVNVGPGGGVTSAALEPKLHETSEWGTCVRSAAKRIVFPTSDGETAVEIPLVVGMSVQ